MREDCDGCKFYDGNCICRKGPPQLVPPVVAPQGGSVQYATWEQAQTHANGWCGEWKAKP